MSYKEETNNRKRILVAVLDWGLGHAARCVPLVKALLAHGHEVCLGANGRALQLLRLEFPQLPYEEFPAYNIRYISDHMIWNMAWQWPKILWAAWREHHLLKQLVDKYHFQVLISDSRFGCFHPKVKSIFLSHQLWIKIPIRPLEIIVNRINHWVIRRFEECWVPDYAVPPRLAGELSDAIPGVSLHYIGILSRMERVGRSEHSQIVAVLSGPEPQRSRLEQLLIQQAQSCREKMVIVQGKTEMHGAWQKVSPNLTLIPALSGQALQQLLVEARIVLCRSGYSSLMDLAKLGIPAILIPTPGQTEQEYLAQSCAYRQLFFYQSQKDFNLKIALEKAAAYNGFTEQDSSSAGLLKAALSRL